MVTPGMLPENNCIEEGLFGGWEQNPKEITCQKNYCPMPSPESDGIWFFGCTGNCFIQKFLADNSISPNFS
jgi:hypothetical protein